ncbi:uncharacterized protein LOC124924095 isoform X1 [Impatiens glandulifera]|uniref:uncharacterized protein LOC124924095 isoform X1 n=1 Tax=Impatiens glandulifera TaxID=253017 RepID=UPI001FB079F6|nr:uncharacterized protein LOC124924095 isoform X1 [Impatiens glandulifera]
MVRFEDFIHPHPLTLTEVLTYDSEKHICKGCGIPIRGYAYTCLLDDCNFYLHKICVDAPKELEQGSISLHPQHHLTIITGPPYSSSSPSPGHFNCHVCAQTFSSGFAYSCTSSNCQFYVDWRCAALTIQFQHMGHKHDLITWLCPSTASFVCNACGSRHEEEDDEDQGISFLCETCPFWIHERCFSLPGTTTIQGHNHPLMIAYGIRGGGGAVYRCFICKEEDSIGRHWFYGCQQCYLLVHIKCLRKSRFAEEKIETIDFQSSCRLEDDEVISLPVPDVESMNQLMLKFIKQLGRVEGQTLQNIAHPHPLFLYEEEQVSSPSRPILNNDKTCNACTLPVVDSPFYECQSCVFILHKWCADLPKEIKEHPCHSHHPLVLITSPKESFTFGFFHCKGCLNTVNGFAFRCAQCRDNYCLCIRCASFPASVSHKKHDHTLYLKQKPLPGWCIGCRFSLSHFVLPCDDCILGQASIKLSYGCNDCNFSIHAHCALLPETMRHKIHEDHRFDLVYSKLSSIDVEVEVEPSAQPFCELCEDEVRTELGCFYVCVDCDMYVCLRCFVRSVGLNSSVVFGGTHDSPYHPQHPLTCVRASKADNLSCERCLKECCLDLFWFECDVCRIMLHLKCAYQP